ncbi:lysophospholipid acyltransferase family protein [Paracrocinitomix mangrovi]|uniref:lysophospholipid acyltransferase family protein n=1 Tax=Paracrocinitomix mangrovi TaxID=2862509 RepID=UPI001C8DEF99|nr:lysophospholipid acyltransferase family protein [Paracrocinitomix mangrovi]UKN02610.1 lysophospholipid acyltransferase family protein [Paracrocinitomix mangrovi]
MLDKFLYYCITIPWSYMPLWMIYRLADMFYFVIRFVIPYRKKVVLDNIRKSFPEKSDKEVKLITKKFYRYFANLFAESVKNLTIPEAKLRKRLVVRNPEIMEELHKEGKSVLLLSSHYNNWEFLINGQSLLFPFQAVGIGMPLSNKFWDKKLNERRERFGMKVVNAGNYKEVIAEFKDTLTATLILNDQSPGKDENCYWVNFLNQETAFYFGAEVLANQNNSPVVNAIIHKVKKGYYEIELKLITKDPRKESYGFITQEYVNQLEEAIIANPQYWLWSHKRWKKEIPSNLEEIKAAHQKRFEEKFR